MRVPPSQAPLSGFLKITLWTSGSRAASPRRGIYLRDEDVAAAEGLGASAGIFALPGIREGKVGRDRCPRHISISGGINSYVRPNLVFAAAEKAGVGQPRINH